MQALVVLGQVPESALAPRLVEASIGWHSLHCAAAAADDEGALNPPPSSRSTCAPSIGTSWLATSTCARPPRMNGGARRVVTLLGAGAGSGDPELLTMKAVRALRRAAMALVDDLRALYAAFGFEDLPSDPARSMAAGIADLVSSGLRQLTQVASPSSLASTWRTGTQPLRLHVQSG